MFDSLIQSIESGFSDLMPQQFCLPCFLKGLAMGLVIGIAAIALLPEELFAAALVLGVIGLAKMAAEWKNMNDAQKSEALGNLAGGALAGGIGKGGFEVPVPRPLVTPEGVVAWDTVMVTMGGTSQAAAAGAVGGGGTAAMMSSEGSGGGGEGGDDSGPPPADGVDYSKVPAASRARVSETLANIDSGDLPYSRDGITFENRDDILPIKQLGYYKEYTVTPAEGVNGRGAERLVTGQDGEIYYSPDHYDSFVRIK